MTPVDTVAIVATPIIVIVVYCLWIIYLFVGLYLFDRHKIERCLREAALDKNGTTVSLWYYGGLLFMLVVYVTLWPFVLASHIDER